MFSSRLGSSCDTLARLKLGHDITAWCAAQVIQ